MHMKKIPLKTWLLVGLAVLTLVTAFPIIVIGVTPEGSVPREWVVNFRQTMLAVWGLVVFVSVLVVTFRPWKKISSAVVRFLLKAVLCVVTLFLLYALLFVLVFGMSWYVEQEDYGDTLLVEEQAWLDHARTALYEKQGSFYMHKLHEVSGPEAAETPAASRPAQPSEPDTEWTEKQERQRISKGAQAVCESLGADYEEHFDAKGNLRVVVTETETSISYLRFDRYSENENCLLYVLSSCEKSPDGSAGGTEEFVNTYAYVLETGDVVPSGKTDWSTPGSEAYQQVTGEP